MSDAVVSLTTDAALLATLHAESFTAPWPAADFDKLLSSPGVTAWHIAGTGLILMRAVADEAEILTLAVNPARRRQGHAARLLAHALAAMAALGAARVFLEVAEDNAPALALYRAAGFTPCGRRSGYYAAQRAPMGKRADAVVMMRALSAA